MPTRCTRTDGEQPSCRGGCDADPRRRAGRDRPKSELRQSLLKAFGSAHRSLRRASLGHFVGRRERDLDRRRLHLPRPALLCGAPGRRLRDCSGRAVKRYRTRLPTLRPEHLPAGCLADRRRAAGARRHH